MANCMIMDDISRLGIGPRDIGKILMFYRKIECQPENPINCSHQKSMGTVKAAALIRCLFVTEASRFVLDLSTCRMQKVNLIKSGMCKGRGGEQGCSWLINFTVCVYMLIKLNKSDSYITHHRAELDIHKK